MSPLATARLLFRGLSVQKDAFSEGDLEVLATALAQPGAMAAMLNWYRAAVRYPPARRTQLGFLAASEL
jgi:epoxide hydrolase 4